MLNQDSGALYDVMEMTLCLGRETQVETRSELSDSQLLIDKPHQKTVHAKVRFDLFYGYFADLNSSASSLNQIV